MLFKLSHLLLCKVHLVRGVPSEGKRVVGVLRVLLVIDVALSVLPVRELRLIAAGIGNRSIIDRNGFHLPLGRPHIEGLESAFLGRRGFHRMRIDDLSLLFSIVDVFLSQETRILDLILELSLVVGDGTLRVRILYETIRAPASPVA